MTDLPDISAIQIARDIARARRESVDQARASQAARRSVELDNNEGVNYYRNGKVAATMGATPEGDIVIKRDAAVSPTPPTPSAPTVEPGLGGVSVLWDGLFVNGMWNDGITQIEVHRLDTIDQTATDATQIGTLPSRMGGGLFHAVDAEVGEKFYCLQAVSVAGVESPVSGRTAATSLPVVDEEMWQEHEDALNTLNTITLPALQDNIDDNNALITNLTTVTLPALQDDLDANEAAITNLTTVTLPALQSDLDANEAAVNAINTVAIPGLQADLTAAENALNTLNTVTLPALQGDLDANSAAIDTLNTTTIPDLQGDLNTANAAIVARARVVFQTNQPAGLTANDRVIWYDTDNGHAASYWNGAAWGPYSLGAGALAADSVTATQIAAGAVTATEIATDAVIAAKILAGAIIAGKIAADAVTATTIAANAVIAGKIATDAVTSNTITANAVTAGKIATDAVTANTIVANAVTAGKIATDAVTTNTIAANAITAVKINALAVTAGKIAADAVTATEIAANAVTTAKINALAVVAGKIAADAVTAITIAADAVTAVKIAANAVIAGKIAADAVTATTIAAGAVTVGKIAADAVTASTIAAGAVTTPKIAAGAVQAGHIQAGSITTTELNSSVLSAGFVLAGSIQVGQQTWNPTEGFIIPQPNGGRIHLPADGVTPASLGGFALLDSATIKGNFNLMGTTNKVSGTLVLSNGITEPTLAPSVYPAWPFLYANTIDGSDTAWRIYNGMAAHHSNANYFVTAVDYFGTQLRIVDRTTGANISQPWTRADFVPGGIGYFSGHYYIYGYDKVSQSFKILRIRASDWVTVGEVVTSTDPFLHWETSATFAVDPGSGECFISWLRRGTSLLNVKRYWADLSFNYHNVDHQDFGAAYNLSASFVGNADEGQQVLYISTDEQRIVLAFPVATLVHSDTMSFPNPANALIRGLMYHSGNGRFYAFGKNGNIYSHSKYSRPQAITASYTWYDSQGTVRETREGPVASYTVQKRSYTAIEAGAPPDNGVTDPLQVDKANQVGIYAAHTGNTRKLQQYPGVDGSGNANRTSWVDVVTAVGANAPASNTFVGGTSSPGRITSGAEVGGVPRMELKGNGDARFGYVDPEYETASLTKATGTGTLDINKAAGIAVLHMEWQANATINAFTAIATAPVGWRPASQYNSVAYNNATGAFVAFFIQPSGAIMFRANITNGHLILGQLTWPVRRGA